MRTTTTTWRVTMKQYEPSEKDLKSIKLIQNNNQTYQFLKNKQNFNFTAGDFLIKLNKRADKWEVETVSNISQVPKRYLCVYEDEFGIKYIRQLTSKGDVLPHITPLTEWSNWTRYEIDPEFAEHIILNGEEEFDFAAQKKKEKSRRDKITRKNKKLVVNFANIQAVDKFLLGLKPGDNIWFGHTIPDTVGSKYEVVAVDPNKRGNTWGRDRAVTVSIALKTLEKSYSHTVEFKSEDIMRGILIASEPHPYNVI